jgi:hypothetical protein
LGCKMHHMCDLDHLKEAFEKQCIVYVNFNHKNAMLW